MTDKKHDDLQKLIEDFGKYPGLGPSMVEDIRTLMSANGSAQTRPELKQFYERGISAAYDLINALNRGDYSAANRYAEDLGYNSRRAKFALLKINAKL